MSELIDFLKDYYASWEYLIVLAGQSQAQERAKTLI